MTIRTQQYALRAYPKINDVKGREIEKKYRTLALTFPTMILQAGLAQAVGFLQGKGKVEHLQYLADLAHVLEIENADSLHTQVIGSTVTEYQYLTRKSLDASAWLKRYTQALLEG